MNTMERIDLDAAATIADEDNDDVTLEEIGDALRAMAAQLDQLGHATIADELRVLGDHLACVEVNPNYRSKGANMRREMPAEGRRGSTVARRRPSHWSDSLVARAR
jgi:hypothetical protein